MVVISLQETTASSEKQHKDGTVVPIPTKTVFVFSFSSHFWVKSPTLIHPFHLVKNGHQPKRHKSSHVRTMAESSALAKKNLSCLIKVRH